MKSNRYFPHHVWLILLLMATLTSCVLTMEDYTLVPEDERGVGRPYTYEDSLVRCTYEFNPGVLPFTDEALNYVIGVQDSTLYIADNIPEKWVPKAGGYISAGNSRTFPYGLGHRVLEVKRANGMYAVKLGRATVDEIFKELDIKMSLNEYQVPEYFVDEYVPDTLFDDDGNVVDVLPFDPNDDTPDHGLRHFTRADAEATSMELAPGGHGIIDWRYVDAAQDAKAGVTRAQPEVKDTTAVIEHKFELNAPELGYSNQVETREENRHIITSYYEENTKKQTSKQWSQEKLIRRVTFKAGVQFSADANIGDVLGDKMVYLTPDNLKKYCDYVREVKLGKYGKARRSVFSPKLQTLAIPFMVGPVPCAFVIRFDVSLAVTLGGFVNITQTQTSDVWRTTVVTEGKKETKTKERISKGEESMKVSFIGSGGMELTLRAGVGVMVGVRNTGVGADIGLGFKGEIKYEVEPVIYSSRTEGLTDARVTSKASFVVDWEPFVDFMGENIWNGRHTLFEKTFLDVALHFTPCINPKKTNGTYTYSYDKDMKGTVHHRRKLCFSRLWSGWFEPSGVKRPVMRVYRGDIEDYDYVDLVPVNSSEGKKQDYTLKTDVVYEYEYDSPEGVELHFVPSIYCEDNQKTYELRYEQVEAGKQQGDPVVIHLEAYQESVNEAKDTREDINGVLYDTYHIADVMRVECTQRLWEVGVYVDLVDTKNVQQFKKLKVSLLKANDVDGPIRAADYKFRLNFSIPASGRQRSVVGVPIYPIITLRPYAIIYKGEGLGTEEMKYSTKQFNLKYPYTTSYNYRGAIDVDM